jgi:hypothetical protein
VAAFFLKQTVTGITFITATTRHSIDRIVRHPCVRERVVPAEFCLGRKGAFL